LCSQHSTTEAAAETFKVKSWAIALRKQALEALKQSGGNAFIDSMVALAVGGSSPRGDQHVLVIDIDTHERLEAISRYLINRGLRLTVNGRFADFAIIHGKHGLSMPCDWLVFEEHETEGQVTFRMPCEHVGGLDEYVVDSSDSPWLDQAGHGFVLSSEDDYEAWLDFNTGTTVVSFR